MTTSMNFGPNRMFYQIQQDAGKIENIDKVINDLAAIKRDSGEIKAFLDPLFLRKT